MGKLLNVMLKLKFLLENIFLLTVFKQFILEVFALLLQSLYFRFELLGFHLDVDDF